VMLIIEDDGAGFEKDEPAGKKRKGLGLIGMRERAALVGGALEIESAKNKGTTVYAKFPLRGKYE
jgi:signal transduction histidine kinase